MKFHRTSDDTINREIFKALGRRLMVSMDQVGSVMKNDSCRMYQTGFQEASFVVTSQMTI